MFRHYNNEMKIINGKYLIEIDEIVLKKIRKNNLIKVTRTDP